MGIVIGVSLSKRQEKLKKKGIDVTSDKELRKYVYGLIDKDLEDIEDE